MEMRKLLEKYLKDECSTEERNKVLTFFSESNSVDSIPTEEEVRALLGELPRLEDERAEIVYANILKRTRRKRFNGSGLRKYAAIAAIFIGVLTTGYFYQQGYFNGSQDAVLIPNVEAITLELDNGNIEVLNEDGTTQVMDANGNVVGTQQGNQLVYTDEAVTESMVYNTLNVPYGKRFEVSLSDGSKAYLNAGSSLKYPIKFLKGENRQVYLYGEAFFDIATDKEHPFIVNADELNVQVLGTEFNVSHYSEEPNIEVVLVEGSVGMYIEGEDFDNDQNTVLVPGTKGSFDRTNSSIDTREVVTSTYTSWVEGRLIFRNMPLDNILKKLERHYNIVIENTNKELGREEFNAGFQNETINEVLQALQTTYGISYTIKENKVIIE